MVENQYISVKEFAQRAGISVQAVYKGVNNRLNQYVKLVDNQKMIDIRALQDIYGIEVEQPIQPELETNSTENSTHDIVIDTFLKQIETLQKELDVKNEQIKEKDKQLSDILKALNQAQHLQAMAENKVKLLEQIQEKNNVVEPTLEPEQSEKKHWWKIWK